MGREVHEKPIRLGNCLKRWDLDSLPMVVIRKKEERGGSVFEGELIPNGNHGCNGRHRKRR